MNRPFFMVQEVQVRGHQTIRTGELQDHINTYLDRQHWWQISQRSLLFVDTDRLDRHLRTLYPKIYETDIDIDLPVLHVDIQERSAHSLWCVDQEYERIFDEECYFADQRGLWYVRAPYFSDPVFMKIFVDPNHVLVQPGQRFMSERDFEDFFEFIAELEALHHITINKTYMRGEQDVYFQLESLSENNYVYQPIQPELIINRDLSYQKTLRNLQLVFDQATFTEQLADPNYTLQYIDLRFEGRAVFRFQDMRENSADPESSENSEDSE